MVVSRRALATRPASTMTRCLRGVGATRVLLLCTFLLLAVDTGRRDLAFGSSGRAKLCGSGSVGFHPRLSRIVARQQSSNVDDDNPMQLDGRTVDLHRLYHEKTIEYTMEHMDWLQSKAYGTDDKLEASKADVVAKAARERFARWPQLEESDTHRVDLGSSQQRFCSTSSEESSAVSLGDPEDNVFVISLPRRPTKLRHALAQLHQQGVSANIVDAVDGDAVGCQQDVLQRDVQPLPEYNGHSNHDMPFTTGEVGCFMSHYSIWHHMVDRSIPAALILEDDFDFQDDFVRRLGVSLQEARDEDWNLMYVGRSPVESDVRQVSETLVEPGYTLWTVGYIIRLDAAKALLDAAVHRNMAPLDDFFSVAMGRYTLAYNEHAVKWSSYIPKVLKPLAISPPLVMPYVGSMFLSDTAMLRNGTRYLKDLPDA